MSTVLVLLLLLVLQLPYHTCLLKLICIQFENRWGSNSGLSLGGRNIHPVDLDLKLQALFVLQVKWPHAGKFMNTH